MRIAVMDFSSTAISLLVEEVSGEMMSSVVGLRRSVSILDYMNRKGKLSSKGIEKVADSVRYLLEAADRVGAESVHLISTASMRIITNYEEVAEAVRNATGLDFIILDGRDEAYADYMANREYAALGDALLLDAGGISAELADLGNSSRDSMYSLSAGPVALFRRFSGMYPDEEEADDIRRYVRKTYRKNGVYPGRVFPHIVLVGGNAEALYSVYADYFSVPPSSFRTMRKKKLRKLVKHLMLSSDDRSALFIRNAPEKVHTILPTALLALETASFFSAREFIISDRGVKEGYLRALMEDKWAN